ncbi:TRAP transporter small permease [Xanthobacteraceae bacterium Astr-EGSB]|uniref:TRAP transporter small permease n=1 Tax=Astrobacterium formosum TaxID=3069710 RepID=UPI0027AEE8A4|nr:TRAP transporter small permease [Xanthobacteraceae bacterium Astr-EGSB]
MEPGNVGSQSALQSRLVKLFEPLIVFSLAAMLVIVFGNVVLRYVFNSGISICEELSRMLFVWMTFIGAVVAVAEGTHLGMDSVIQRLPRKGVIICAIVSDLMIVACTMLVAHGAWQQTIVNMDNVAPVSQVPLGFVHASVLVASVAIILITSGRFWRVVTGRAGEHDLIQVRDSEDPAATQSEAVTK